MINLTPEALKQLSIKIKSDIDTYCADKYDDGPRSHLGASEIGHKCSKYLWLKFRWCFHKKHDGRQQRLFQRGHFEEPRFVSYLEGIGFTIQMFAKALFWHPESDSYLIEDINFQENNLNIDAQMCVNVTDNPDHLKLAEEQGIKFDKGKMQIRISACKGHFGGSVDGVGEHSQYGTFLTEFKTQGVGKKGENFNKLVKQGVKAYKPVHYAQMCIYGYKLGLKYAVYVSVNKNDDELHVEVVELDWNLGAALERKAEMIIFADSPPPAISMNKAYFECNYCDACPQCHDNADILKNCRSCREAIPVDDAQWYCGKWQAIIPKEQIPLEHECWLGII